MAGKYSLRVTAGPNYDSATHTPVSVNTPHPTKIISPLGSALISVRIQNYHGFPPSSPSTSPYFSHPAHAHDQYSISFLLRPNASIPGSSLVFGNDFSHPIRDRLPPGFNTALRIVKWAIDPGVDGDVYSDTPYLYGNALSSLNVLKVMGAGDELEEWEEELETGLEEGGGKGGEEVRREMGVPEGAQARKKWFLEKGRTDQWVWEKGRVYGADFFNPYLDFNEFSLKLPGFSLSFLRYLGGEDYLRYVLKNKDTNEIFFVLLITLVPRDDELNRPEEEEEEEEEEVDEDDEDDDENENEKEKSSDVKTRWVHVNKQEEEGKKLKEKEFETSPDDLD